MLKLISNFISADNEIQFLLPTDKSIDIKKNILTNLAVHVTIIFWAVHFYMSSFHVIDSKLS
jgi:hypothetical protein